MRRLPNLPCSTRWCRPGSWTCPSGSTLEIKVAANECKTCQQKCSICKRCTTYAAASCPSKRQCQLGPIPIAHAENRTTRSTPVSQWHKKNDKHMRESPHLLISRISMTSYWSQACQPARARQQCSQGYRCGACDSASQQKFRRGDMLKLQC